MDLRSEHYAERVDTDPAAEQDLPSGGTRERLVAAGRELADSLPLARIYAGITTAAAAERAGVTTGSFFHHFPSATHFADALVRSFLEEHQDQGETVDEMVDALEHADLLTIMRENLRYTWGVVSTDPLITSVTRGQMLLFAHHRQELLDPTPDLPDVGSVLRRTYRIRQEDASRGWAYLLDRTGMSLIQPFTTDRISTALTALSLGLQIRSAVDPGAVDDDLFSDVSTTLTAAVTQPRAVGRRRVTDVPGGPIDDSDLSPQARSGARRRRETRRRITDAATGMFDRGWESVTASDVAEAAVVSSQTVINLFGSVRGVAACTFGHRVQTFDAVLQERLVVGDPGGAVRAAIRQLALDAAADPEVARALLSERVAATLHQGQVLTDSDVRVEVPLALGLVTALEQLDIGDADPVDLASTLVNTALAHAIPRPGRADETVELVMRLVDPLRGPDAGAGAGRPAATR
jgi:AcrR family transcriptional regulator